MRTTWQEEQGGPACPAGNREEMNRKHLLGFLFLLEGSVACKLTGPTSGRLDLVQISAQLLINV